jgi:hypothetical protein
MTLVIHATPPRAGAPIALGLRAMRGGGVCVAVGVVDGAPVIALSRQLAFGGGDAHSGLYERSVQRLLDGADRVSVEREIARTREEWEAAAEAELGTSIKMLDAAGWTLGCVNLLVNRAGWVGDVLAYGLSSLEHARVAEGLALRAALRGAALAHGVATVETDEKSLRDHARAAGIEPAIEAAQLRAMGMKAGPPWRAEWKAAALAAWISALSLA